MPVSLLQIRNVDDETAAHFKAAASLRLLTYAEYLRLLVNLHDVCRTRASAGDDGIAAELRALGLETVTVSA